MSRIRAPRTPKNEQAGVTIANQANEIRTLIIRVEDLSAKLLLANGSIESLVGQKALLDGLLEEQREQYVDLSDAYSRLTGWQDCAREMLAKYGPL